MSIFFYNLFLFFFRIGIGLASLFNGKAKKWVNGRKNVFERLETAISGQGPLVWIHCASLGEFEQGRPVIESLKKQYSTHKILLTFFSPSGYEIRKDYNGVDWVFYLPLDSPRNAKRFLDITQPSLVIFVKYEFWFYYLKKTRYRNIPLILISAIFWEEMSFFKWYGALQRKMITRFNHIFVQDQTSMRLLQNIGAGEITSISGDTRFDRVAEIAANQQSFPVIETFLQNRQAIVLGSSWPEDEALFAGLLPSIQKYKSALIIAPHEISNKHLDDLKSKFPKAVCYSEVATNAAAVGESDVLIIDNIGLLSHLYRYAWITYVGGGFGKGIHNILEAAVHAKPVIFGPVFHKFREAKEMLSMGAAISVSNANELEASIEKLRDAEVYKTYSEIAGAYVKTNQGATEKILFYIQENRLLTN